MVSAGAIHGVILTDEDARILTRRFHRLKKAEIKFAVKNLHRKEKINFFPHTAAPICSNA
jgi:hypothetical protein